MSPRTVLASVVLVLGLVALVAGVGMALTAVQHSVQTPKGAATVDCGRPWPSGATSGFNLQQDVADAAYALPDSTRAAAVNAWEADCRTALGLNRSLARVLAIGGVLMVGGGVVLLMVRQRRQVGRQA